MQNATITRVRPCVWRINHPQTNAALTRSGGFGSPRLYTRIMTALTKELPHLEDVNEQVGVNIVFKRGLNSKHWYFTLEPIA